MSAIDKALQEAVSAVPECVATGYVDLSTGMLLGIKTVDSHPQEILELLAAATSDLFQGSNVSTIESLFKKARGLDPKDQHHYFQEMIINSDNLIHLFLRGKANEEHVCVFVCRKSANLGMALTKAKAAAEKIESVV